jgi:hypothetical protein
MTRDPFGMSQILPNGVGNGEALHPRDKASVQPAASQMALAELRALFRGSESLHCVPSGVHNYRGQFVQRLTARPARRDPRGLHRRVEQPNLRDRPVGSGGVPYESILRLVDWCSAASGTA